MQIARFLVGGEWRESREVRPVVNPYSAKRVGEVFQAGESDIADAIAAAVSAFDHTKRLSSHVRSAILKQIAVQIESRKEEFARLITTETGKPITFSRGEVDRSIFTFGYAAEEARRIGGDVLPLDLAGHSERRLGITRRFPVGPIGAISPFNFPLNLVAHKVAPAIAAGNPIVLKPSSNAPLTALRLAELIHNSELPKGGFSCVICSGGKADQLITDERIKLISFTGSPEVGWALKSRAGRKKVVLELGGNAGVILDRDTNLGFAVRRIVSGSFGNAGQSCIAVQRIYVHQDLFGRFKDEFLKLTNEVVVGDPDDERTVVGPMIEEAAAIQVEGWIKEAVVGGARILCGGKRSGAMLEPTVLTDVSPSARVSCQEVFAPVVTLEAFSDFDDALERVNNSSFGLQAGVFSNSLRNVFHAYETLEVGGVVINDFPTYRIDHMPYGGVKHSGFGREGIKYAIEEMTEPKLMVLNLASHS